MATPKELGITTALVAAATAVNSCNDGVNVKVDITRYGVQVMISPQETEGDWEWIFYPQSTAYFSNESFDEEVFVDRCDAFLAEINKHMISRDADGVPV